MTPDPSSDNLGDASIGDDSAFDALLRSALRSRPEILPPTNLAVRAMQIARAEMASEALRAKSDWPASAAGSG